MKGPFSIQYTSVYKLLFSSPEQFKEASSELKTSAFITLGDSLVPFHQDDVFGINMLIYIHSLSATSDRLWGLFI